MKWTALWTVIRVGNHAFDRLNIPIFALPQARDRAQQRPGVGMLGVREHCLTSAFSTTSPRYMTSTSSQVSAMTPRSCVISITDMPRSRWSSRINSMIWACVVTSRAVVGSSAINSVGCTPAPSQSSRAGASRRSVRMDKRPPAASVSGCQPFAAFRSPDHALLSYVICWCSSMASMIWKPIVCIMLSEVIGSWKIMAISLPRIERIALAARIERGQVDRLAEPGRLVAAAALQQDLSAHNSARLSDDLQESKKP